MSEIRDENLAPSGERKINWVQDHMPVLRSIHEDFIKAKPFSGLKVALSVHMEAKTAYLATVIRDGGAEVFATGCNPLSTQDDVAAALAARGVNVFAWRGESEEEYTRHLSRVLEGGPQIIIDDGAPCHQPAG